MTTTQAHPDMDALIYQYMGLAQSIARQIQRTAPHALELDELCGIANYGLVAAARRWPAYCSEKGHDPFALQYFKTFVVRRVHGAIIDHIRAADFANRTLRDRAKLLREAGQDRHMTDNELAERTGLTVKEVRSTIRGISQRPVSIEAEELDPASDSSVESSASSKSMLAALVDVILSLTPEEQVVLALYYYEGQQLQEIARTLSMSKSHVSQLHAGAVLAVHGGLKAAAGQRDELD